jgi:hypothetical protein
MRCLGRLVVAILLILLLAAGWLYRTEIVRYARGVVDPMSVARRTGAPSPAALASAERKVIQLVSERADSVLLTASELASLVVQGSELLGVRGVDSVSVELGERRIRVRAMVETAHLPARIRSAIPGSLASHEEVIAEGPITPARPGTAEWELDRVIVRGLPLPADLVARVLARVSGRQEDGRLLVSMPPQIEGFRVRPEGVAIYRSVEE